MTIAFPGLGHFPNDIASLCGDSNDIGVFRVVHSRSTLIFILGRNNPLYTWKRQKMRSVKIRQGIIIAPNPVPVCRWSPSTKKNNFLIQPQEQETRSKKKKACVFGAKSLSDLILTYCQRTLKDKLEWIYNIFFFKKMYLKWRRQNVSHFVLSPMW